jgi:hypothetical protein
MSTALVSPSGLDLEGFARAAGLHPQLVERLIRLGLIDTTPGGGGEQRVPLSQLTAVARLQRLRAGLCLNYAALGLVVDLLDRIDALEARLAARPAEPTTPRRTVLIDGG